MRSCKFCKKKGLLTKTIIKKEDSEFLCIDKILIKWAKYRLFYTPKIFQYGSIIIIFQHFGFNWFFLCL